MLPKNQTEKCAFHRESHWGFRMLFTGAGSETSHHHSVLDAQDTNRHRTGSGVCSIVISQGVPVVKDVGGVCGESFAAAKKPDLFFFLATIPDLQSKSKSKSCASPKKKTRFFTAAKLSPHTARTPFTTATPGDITMGHTTELVRWPLVRRCRVLLSGVATIRAGELYGKSVIIDIRVERHTGAPTSARSKKFRHTCLHFGHHPATNRQLHDTYDTVR